MRIEQKPGYYAITNDYGVDVPAYFSDVEKAHAALGAIPERLLRRAEKSRGCFSVPREIRTHVAPYSDVSFSDALRILRA